MNPIQVEYTPAQSDWLKPVKAMKMQKLNILGVIKRHAESFSVCRKLESFFSAQGIGLKRRMTRDPERLRIERTVWI